MAGCRAARLGGHTPPPPKKKKAIIYTRTSSKANANGSSRARQTMSCKKVATRRRDVQTSNITAVSEVISGSLPLERRGKLLDILSGSKVLKVFVESARAVARSAVVAEQAWKVAKDNGVEIVEQGGDCGAMRSRQWGRKSTLQKLKLTSRQPSPLRLPDACLWSCSGLAREPWLAQPSSYCVQRGARTGIRCM